MAKMRYEARVSDNLGRLHNFKLSPRFATIQECQDYIYKELDEIEELLTKAFNRILCINNMISLGGSFIRVYDTEQKRFITGFDV